MQDLSHGSYVIGLPDGWTDGSVVAFYGAPGEKATPSVMVSSIAGNPSVTAAVFAKLQWEGLLEECGADNIALISEHNERIGELDAFWRIHDLSLDDDQTLRQLQVYVMCDDGVYIVTATSASDDFEDHQSAFEDSIRAFRLVNNRVRNE